MKDEKIPGIYCIRCLENDKLYIGESRDVYARWKQHTKDLKTNSHHNTPL